MNKAGRPKEFDREQALERAMELFWKQGYEATGMNELIDQMQIGRQSLYDTFGDKRQLYIEAFRHYHDSHIETIVQKLSEPGSPIENIRQVMKQIAAEANNCNCVGCFLTNTLVENAQQDQDITTVTTASIRRLEQSFKKTLARAIEANEIPQNSNIRGLARFLVNTIQGLVVMGKATSNHASAKEVVAVALSVLDHK